jgi:hypothetical protein
LELVAAALGFYSLGFTPVGDITTSDLVWEVNVGEQVLLFIFDAFY